MNGTRLRELQAPLKARYNENPSSATVTLRAKGRVFQESVSCKLETGKPGVAAGLHPAAGGDGSAACSGDMLLEALVGCAGVTFAAGPAITPTHDAAYWDRVTAGFDFSIADQVPTARFNRVLWAGLMGNAPYPAVRRPFFAR